MSRFILFITTWVIIYLLYLIFVIIRKDKLKLFKNNSYVKYLSNVYKVNVKEIDNKKLANIIGLSNGFIIALTILIIDFISNFYLKMFIALVLVILLQLFIYHIIGKLLKRRDKNV